MASRHRCAHRGDKPVTPRSCSRSCCGAVLRELNERQAGPAPDLNLLMQACDTVLKAQQSRSHSAALQRPDAELLICSRGSIGAAASNP